MIKIKSIKPMFTMLVTTANTYENNEGEGGIITRKKGTLKEYQTVVAVGNMVRDVKVGDMIMINPSRFAVHKRDKNSIANDIEGGNPVLTYKFDFIELDGKPFMKLQDRDVDYVVEDYEEVDNSINDTIITEETKKGKLILPKAPKVIV